MAVKDLNKKVEKLSVAASKEARAGAEWRKENRGWLRNSFEIALHVQSAIKTKGWNQKQLAEAMGVSPQQVSKIMKGRENLTLQTIDTLEKILETKLIETPPHAGVKIKTEKVSAKKNAEGKGKRSSSKDKTGRESSTKSAKKYGAARKASKVAEPGKRK